jgi:hypothetical protein
MNLQENASHGKNNILHKESILKLIAELSSDNGMNLSAPLRCDNSKKGVNDALSKAFEILIPETQKISKEY